MNTRARTTSLTLLALALAPMLGCPQPMRPLVVSEHIARPAARPGENTLTPPACGSQPLPEYPSVLTERNLPPIAVMATFTVSLDGGTRDVTTAMIDKSEYAPILIRATESAIQAWRCEPARRAPWPEEGEAGPQPVESQATVMFRFYADESQRDRTTP